MSDKSDRELELLRRKKLLELRKRFERKAKTETEKAQTADQREVLNRFLIGRAWEVLNAAKAQYPHVARQVESLLVRLITQGKVRGKITGEELYGLFLRLGLRVRLPTRIRIVEHGKVKSLEEKMKEEISQ